MAKTKKKLESAGPVKTPKTVIPQNLLHQIGEFSPRGFFLLSLGENDEFVVNYVAENDMVALSMIKFLSNHTSAMDDAHSQAIQNRIHPPEDDQETV
jgi:hypothetical protein